MVNSNHNKLIKEQIGGSCGMDFICLSCGERYCSGCSNGICPKCGSIRFHASNDKFEDLADAIRVPKRQQYKIVRVPRCEQHQGLYTVLIRLKWRCPICGKPRGEIKNVRSYDGSLMLNCDGWTNLCGHIDKYSQVIEEGKIVS